MGTLTLIGGPSAKNIRTFIILYIFGNVSSYGKRFLSLGIFSLKFLLYSPHLGHRPLCYGLPLGSTNTMPENVPSYSTVFDCILFGDVNHRIFRRRGEATYCYRLDPLVH